MEQNNVPAALLTLVVGVGVTLVSLWYGVHNGLMPEQASEQAPLVDGFFNLMVTIGTSLFLVVEGALIYALIRFRRRGNDSTDAEPITGNLPLEAFWTAIPAIIVIVVGIYSVEVFREMGGFLNLIPDTAPTEEVAIAGEAPTALPQAQYGYAGQPERANQPPDVVVDVQGIQFAWLYSYPNEGNLITGELHVPLGKDVLLNLSSQDVIHSFWVPQFRLKQDAIPGKATELRFVATKLGTYPVVCAELCGGYHGAMRGELVVDTEADYEAWLADNRVAAQPDGSALAVNPANLSDEEFLEPYQDRLGIDASTLNGL